VGVGELVEALGAGVGGLAFEAEARGLGDGGGHGVAPPADVAHAFDGGVLELFKRDGRAGERAAGGEGEKGEDCEEKGGWAHGLLTGRGGRR